MEMTERIDALNGFNLLMLTLIRGTTPLMMFLAVTQLNSASLVVACKCVITCIFLGVSLLWTHSTGQESMKIQVHKNLHAKGTYWRCFVLGVFQASLPFVMVVHSLRYLPITLLAVFMASVPWLVVALHAIPIFKSWFKLQPLKILGIVLGIVGVVVAAWPVVNQATAPCFHALANATSPSNASRNLTLLETTKAPASVVVFDTCLSYTNVLLALLELVAAVFLWASSTIFWRSHKGDIHYLVSGFWKNLFGSVVAAIVWAIFDSEVIAESNWGSYKGIIGIMFLGLGSGWIASLLVHQLSFAVGVMKVNQFMVAVPVIAFIEDCILIDDVVTIEPWVTMLVFVGVFLVALGTVLVCRVDASKENASSVGLSERLLDDAADVEAQSFQDPILQAEIDRLEESNDHHDDGDIGANSRTILDDDDEDMEEEISVTARLPSLKEVPASALPHSL